MEELLIGLIRKQMTHLTRVDMDSALADLGYESFTFIELVVAIEEALGIEFDDEYLNYRRFDNLRAVSTYVDTCVASRDKTAKRG